MQLWSQRVKPRIVHRRTASMYVVYSNELVLHQPAMHWLLELDDPPVGVARRRHSVPSQHCAAIARYFFLYRTWLARAVPRSA